MNRCLHSGLRLTVWVLFVLLGVWASATVGLRAQEAAPAADQAAVAPAAAEGAEAEGTTRQLESIGKLVLVNADWFAMGFYVVLVIFSCVALASILERLVHLRRGRILPDRFVRELRELTGNKQDTLENLRELSVGTKAPVASILHAGVLRGGRPLPEVEKAMEDAALRELAALRGRNRPLSVVASVAPLVGLLGTVVGMIFAFRDASQAGLGKADVLAEGIYMALITTAAGLTIAIPSLLCSAWFSAKVERFMREVDEVLMETLPAFTRIETIPTNNHVAAEQPAAPEPVGSQG